MYFANIFMLISFLFCFLFVVGLAIYTSCRFVKLHCRKVLLFKTTINSDQN